MKPVLREQRGGREFLLTKNLARGRRVYNEGLVLREGEEYRTWDPFRSKLAGAILKGLPDDVIRPGDKVLYLGTSTGTTVSHVSDIVGDTGVVIGVEFAPRVAREFVENVARHRKNVIPFVADARDPAKYTMVQVDVVYCDIAQPDQTELAIKNSRLMLRKGGKLLLVVKSRSIDVLEPPERIFKREASKLEEAMFKVIDAINLEPFEEDHALIYAIKEY